MFHPLRLLLLQTDVPNTLRLVPFLILSSFTYLSFAALLLTHQEPKPLRKLLTKIPTQQLAAWLTVMKKRTYSIYFRNILPLFLYILFTRLASPFEANQPSDTTVQNPEQSKPVTYSSARLRAKAKAKQ
jgi:hypothetical protein